MIVASMVDVLSAATVTVPLGALRSLPVAWASTPPVMMFSAQAPAPLTATPTVPPPPTAMDAANATESITALSVAVTLMAPAVASTLASTTTASTSLSMLLRASVTPTDKARPAVPPKPAAIEAAPAKA